MEIRVLQADLSVENCMPNRRTSDRWNPRWILGSSRFVASESSHLAFYATQIATTCYNLERRKNKENNRNQLKGCMHVCICMLEKSIFIEFEIWNHTIIIWTVKHMMIQSCNYNGWCKTQKTQGRLKQYKVLSCHDSKQLSALGVKPCNALRERRCQGCHQFCAGFAAFDSDPQRANWSCPKNGAGGV